MVDPGIAAIVGTVATGSVTCSVATIPYLKRKYDSAKKLNQSWRNLQAVQHILTKDIPGKEEEMMQMSAGVRELEAKYAKVWKINIFKRARLSQKMKELAEQIASLEKQGYRHRQMSNSDTDDLPWVSKKVDQIWEHLEDKKSIGLHGFMGTGKTTIMRSLNDRAYRTGSFNYVIFVTLGERDWEETIRRSILEQLGMPDVRIALQDKTYLLLIDQVPEKIDLQSLGISLDSRENRKLVVATRDKHVCQQMDMEQCLKVEYMSDRDALEFFCKIVGREENRVTSRIVEQCGNIPQLIKAVAANLKDKDDDYWDGCLNNLQSSKEKYLKDFDDLCITFNSLYGELDDIKKKCFPYGALFPEGDIDEAHLVECWRAEQFIPEAGGSNNLQIFRRARDEGHFILESLIDKCFLDRCSEVKYVTMPSLFRNWVLNKQDEFLSLVQSSNGVSVSTTHKDRAKATKVSVNYCTDLSNSLKDIDLKLISSLFLHRSEKLKDISDDIFVRGSRLEVLDLSYTDIKSLPASISNLLRLKALYLTNCNKLDKLPTQIRKLSGLEILDIRRTGVSHWPSEIMHLTGLRCLKVSLIKDTNQAATPPQVAPGRIILGQLPDLFRRQPRTDDVRFTSSTIDIFAGLIYLEELVISVDEDYESRWNDVTYETWKNNVHKIADSVAKLGELTTLHFHFPTIRCLADFVSQSASWKNTGTFWEERTFRSFKLRVGSLMAHHEIDVPEHKADRHLKLFPCNEPFDAISEVLQRSCTFELIGHESIEHLSSFGTDNIAGLKVCAIQGCSQMESIIRGDNEEVDQLQKLRQLHLINLSRLTSLCKGLMGQQTLANLTTLVIKDCHRLTVVLPCEIAQRSPLLEHLTVENCSQTAVIIGKANEDVANAITEVVTENSSQTTLIIEEEDAITGIVVESRSTTTVITMEINEDVANTTTAVGQNNAIIREDREITEDVQKSTISLSKLKSLKLVKLPTLHSIWQNVFSLKCRSLREVWILECPRLLDFPLVSENAPKLKSINCHQDWWNCLELDDNVRIQFRKFCCFIPRTEINAEERR